MSKEVRSVTLDPDVDSYLSTPNVNASGLINRLVKHHQLGGGDGVQMLELRRQQLRSEIESMERSVEAKREELERINEQISEYETDIEEIVREADEALDEHLRSADNPAVKNWAQKAGISQQKLLEKLASLE